jgi:hypothetical protein
VEPSNEELNLYPANPQHSSFVSPNWFYPDGSNYQFDGHPRYVLNEWSDEIFDGIYDVPENPRFTRQYTYNGWTNWADKFQKDARFSSQTDLNARATLFPEVHDPWMFTEYLFQGTTTYDDFIPPSGVTPSINVGIVEPPLIVPTAVARTLTVDPSGQTLITASSLVAINDQPATQVAEETQVIFDLENKWQSEAGAHKTYWQSELEAMGWQEYVDNDVNRDFVRLDEQRRVVKYAVPMINSGVRLYRERVWSRSTRWGQSGNVPPRTVNLTGPKEFFNPSGMFTGRIVPKVKVTWGVPLYEVIPDPVQEPQYAIKYHSYYSTAAVRICLFKRTLSGADGDPGGDFTYPLAPSDFNGALEVPMPRENTTALEWNDPNFTDDDLVHRGCAFWQGKRRSNADSVGKARCSYFFDNLAQFTPLFDQTNTYTTDTDVEFATPPFAQTQSRVVLQMWTTAIPEWREMSTLSGFTLAYGKNAAGLTIQVRALDNGGTGTSHQSWGNALVAGQTVKVRCIVTRNETPYPHKTLCASYHEAPVGDPNPKDYSKQQYIKAGGKCPFYTPQGRQVVGSYQAVAANGAEWANLQRGLPANYKKNRPRPTSDRRCSPSPGSAPSGSACLRRSGCGWRRPRSRPTRSPAGCPRKTPAASRSSTCRRRRP